MIKVIHDIFPAKIQAISQDAAIRLNFSEFTQSDLLHLHSPEVRTVENLRVVIVEEEGYKTILIASDSSEGPGVVFAEQLTQFNPSLSPHDQSKAQTLSGKIVTYEKMEDCNCSSKLKGWSPFKAMRALKEPKPEPVLKRCYMAPLKKGDVVWKPE